MAGYDGALAEAFRGLPPDVTEENIQSRIRGNLLMAMSNKFRSILLTTGNKSELAVGYCTIYGDMSGGLAVISDLPKTMVYSLSHWINTRKGEAIPAAVLVKPPSAELRPDQRDEDSLPPYDVLDAILHRLIEKSMGTEEIIADGFDPQVVRRVVGLVRQAEFKRRQAAPGLKVTDRAFGVGWRMPIAAKVGI
jgi:NAD+ synthase/NAD+ synthase (glutamine-hydrolysing)